MPAKVVGTLKDFDLYNLHEAAEYLEMSHANIKHHVYNTQKLPVVVGNGKSYFISKRVLDEYKGDETRKAWSGQHMRGSGEYNIELSDDAMLYIHEHGLNLDDVQETLSRLGITSAKLDHIKKYCE